jgi:hypothetical protein
MSATAMDPKLAQRLSALEKANERRKVMFAYERALRSGELTLDSVMADPPQALCHLALIDLIRMARTFSVKGRGHREVWVERLGRRAVLDNINLCIPLGRASMRSRSWVAENTPWNRRRRTAR